MNTQAVLLEWLSDAHSTNARQRLTREDMEGNVVCIQLIKITLSNHVVFAWLLISAFKALLIGNTDEREC